jgi:glycerol-3-phosphate dehydrogenase
VLLYQHQVTVMLNCAVTGISDGVVSSERGDIQADCIINAAGLYADEVARTAGVSDYEIRALKGDYYYTLRYPIGLPVYPPPQTEHHTLGIHLTPSLGREVLIGPSEIPSDKENYRIETERQVFIEALRSMLQGVDPEDLEIYEGFSGNRPRAYRKGQRLDDFTVVRHPSSVVHLLGIESPGLSAAIALARHVYALVV